ncbi:MAG: hypothetical protein KDE59_02940 [Anaerolineales bacterium]|nr:hypothetical protein [Anaerolineales bacterium]
MSSRRLAIRDWKSSRRQLPVGIILSVALIGFEFFNFDTTKYALHHLFGELTFAGVNWAAILAFAFCGIDFAGLIRLLTPEIGRAEPKEVWLLTGAWLLGATMNALMTWYAVALVIANRPVGVGTLSQLQIQTYAPIFVAILVWLTRILFIGSLTVALDQPDAPTHTATSRRSAFQTGTPAVERQSLDELENDFLEF